MIGHSPFTCSQMYCAEVKGANGEEVLRFYEYERIRGVYYQMDFWLEGNRLMSAVRIENPNEEVVPMYWWSNMATPEYPGGRVAVAASRAYNNSDGMGIKKSSIPVDRGIDVSYPENIPDTIDYFYDIPDREQKFIANTDKDGFGLLRWSSLRLKGRKLFSWGHRKGSAHWQSLLTDSAGDYVEIQAGLGKTQYECLPMPPKTSWSFAECYTLADIGAQAVRGDYSDFVAAVKAQIAQFGDSDALESRLDDITKDISLQKGELLLRGSGAGSLGDVPPQLEFVGDEESAYWRALSENSDSCGGAVSFPFGARQRDILLENRSRSNWRICYQLALLAYDERNFADAKSLCGESMVYDNNLYNNYLYTFIMHQLGDKNMLYFADKCLTLCRGEYSVTESIFGLLLESGNYGRVISAFPELSDELQKMPRLRMYLAIAYLHSANAEKAQELLLENGGLELLDIREGDRTLDRLYRGIRKELFDEDPKKVTVPEQFDFIVADQKD